MKIIYNIAGLFNAGGMERVLTNKANYLAKAGHEVMIVTTDQQDRSPYFDLNDNIKRVDLSVNYGQIQHLPLLTKIWAYWRRQKLHEKALRNLLCEFRPDVVISMFDHDVSFLHNMRDGSKKILEIHFSRFKRMQYGRRGVWGVVDRLRSSRDLQLAKKYDRFVVLTEEDKGNWGDLTNICVIPNANSFLMDGVAPLDKKVAIAVGRLDYQKGFDDLIKIWTMIQPAFSDWHLNIYGEGKLKTYLQRLIENLGMEEHIHLCEPTTNIQQAYLSSSVCLMTSRYEGLPMVLLEAQACGLPLIAYTCACGPRDIIAQGVNGYLIDEGDRFDFASKLRKILGSDSIRVQMGGDAKAMSDRFSEEVIMARWTNLFEDVLKEKK